MGGPIDNGGNSIGATVDGARFIAAAFSLFVQQRAADPGRGRIGVIAKKALPLRFCLAASVKDFCLYRWRSLAEFEEQKRCLDKGEIKDGIAAVRASFAACRFPCEFGGQHDHCLVDKIIEVQQFGKHVGCHGSLIKS